MTIQLTVRQSEALEAGGGGPPRAIDPLHKTTYVLISEQDYQAMREALDEERREQVIRRIALRNAAGRMAEPA